MAEHVWIKSELGHGETMCAKCMMTNREAAVLGLLDACSRRSRETPYPGQAGVMTMPKMSIEVEADDNVKGAEILLTTAKAVHSLCVWAQDRYGDNADAALSTYLQSVAALHALEPSPAGRITFTPKGGSATADADLGTNEDTSQRGVVMANDAVLKFLDDPAVEGALIEALDDGSGNSTPLCDTSTVLNVLRQLARDRAAPNDGSASTVQD